jgi:hypothetical protein
MKVTIKDFDVEMSVKNNGVEFDVADNNGEHLGDVILTKTGVIWCKGKTSRAKGKKLSWEQFIGRIEED